MTATTRQLRILDDFTAVVQRINTFFADTARLPTSPAAA
jgi:hypothetical protein